MSEFMAIARRHFEEVLRGRRPDIPQLVDVIFRLREHDGHREVQCRFARGEDFHWLVSEREFFSLPASARHDLDALRDGLLGLYRHCAEEVAGLRIRSWRGIDIVENPAMTPGSITFIGADAASRPDRTVYYQRRGRTVTAEFPDISRLVAPQFEITCRDIELQPNLTATQMRALEAEFARRFQDSMQRAAWSIIAGALGAVRPVDPAADARGMKLLREWLSAEQLAQFDRTGTFEVIGSDTGKRYQISTGRQMNVHELDKRGRPRLGWCFVPEGGLVAGDVMLAQKLALETEERAALAVANPFYC